MVLQGFVLMASYLRHHAAGLAARAITSQVMPGSGVRP